MRAQNTGDVVFINGTAVLPDSLVPDAQVVTRQGKIQGVYPGGAKVRYEKAKVVDAKGGYLVPGFVELHVHGGDNADYMDGTINAVLAVNRCHARHGTTSIHPTTTTGSPEQIMAMIKACANVQRNWTADDGATIPGIHLYGPFFAENKVGAHPKAGRRDPSKAEWERYFNTGMVRIATCAAELPKAADFYKAARKYVKLITVGHSDATWTQMAAAYKLGVRHVDHFWCAMSSIPGLRTRYGTPMQGSMAEFVLFEKGMSTEVIADGMHLSPELLEFAYRMIGPDRLCLVTDSNRALDMPVGEYKIGPLTTGEKFLNDGKVGYIPNQGLASAVVGMDHMVRHMKKATTANLPEVVRMASLTPAKRAGIAKQVGSLEAGKRADVVVMNRKLNVKRVFIAGEEFTGMKK